jgi:molecular chaperone DnaK
MTYEVEKNVKEWGEKLPADVKTRLDAAIERSRKALRGDDLNEIKAAQEELSKMYSEAGQTFYAQSQAQPSDASGGQGGPTSGGPTGTSGTSGAPKDDVVEADYEIVDESKK